MPVPDRFRQIGVGDVLKARGHALERFLRVQNEAVSPEFLHQRTEFVRPLRDGMAHGLQKFF